MKRTLIGILAGIVVLSLGTAGALAAGPGCERNFVDVNGDGICDDAGTFCRYVDSDGDGICDHAHSHGMGHGCGFRGGCGR